MNYADDPRFVERTDQVVSILERVAREHAPAAFACAFGAEDMVLLDLIATHAPSIDVFTLDTGRLPSETHDLLSAVRKRYAIDIRGVQPDREAVARYIARHGVDGFYTGVAQRQACCDVRKVQPLARALKGHRAWITGLRRAQSEARAHVPLEDYDAAHGLLKFNPLAEWTTPEVWTYLRANRVPYNALHDRGYPSIGCEPCTRAVRSGESLRAGRWWWEGDVRKECGLHISPVRIVSSATSDVVPVLP
jgi:phosphoadenosine phosphosulfate reductase